MCASSNYCQARRRECWLDSFSHCLVTWQKWKLAISASKCQSYFQYAVNSSNILCFRFWKWGFHKSNEIKLKFNKHRDLRIQHVNCCLRFSSVLMSALNRACLKYSWQGHHQPPRGEITWTLPIPKLPHPSAAFGRINHSLLLRSFLLPTRMHTPAFPTCLTIVSHPLLPY